MPESEFYSEFLIGGIAAFTNIWITFPIHKISFRQQILKQDFITTCNVLRSEGLNHLYRGVSTPLLERTVSVSLMFGLYDHFFYYTENKMTASILMSTMLTSIMMPFRRIQAILQNPIYNKTHDGAIQGLVSLRKYGIKEYYRGLPYYYVSSVIGSILYFNGKEHLLNLIPESWTSHTKSFLSGGCLGAVISIIIYPITATKHMVVSQIGSLGLKQAIHLSFGGSGIFTGLPVYALRSMMSWSIITVIHDALKEQY